MIKIAIIILNYNGKKDTLECLQSLKSLKRPQKSSLNIIVVDNGSTNSSAKIIKNKFPQIKLILNNKNLGFAKGNNRGIQYALKTKNNFIMILNNDTITSKNLLVELVHLMKKNDKIGIVSPKIYFAPGYEFHKKRYSKKERGKVIWYAGGIIDWKNIYCTHKNIDKVDRKKGEKATETEFATGCCMLIKKEVFEKIGFFDEKYFLYWEDVDFSIRAKKSNYKIFYSPRAKIWHKNASSSEGAGSSTSVYYQTRNRILFALKFAKPKTKLAVFKQAIKYLLSDNYLQKKASKDFFLLKFGKSKSELS